MGGEGISIDEFMEYDSMVMQTFKSENEAYKFYLGYVKNKGFVTKLSMMARWRKRKENNDEVCAKKERRLKFMYFQNTC